MEIAEGTKYGGHFEVDGKQRTGEITFDGSATNLRVQDSGPFEPAQIKDRAIHGVLHDRTRLSLLLCNAPPNTNLSIVHGETYEFADIFPHYVLHGARHLSPTDAAVSSIRFFIDDAPTIFYDYGAFAHVLDPEPFIDALVKANPEKLNLQVAQTGAHPAIAYFTGKTRIFTAYTRLGEVSASHNPLPAWSRPNQAVIGNRVSVDVTFPEPVVFDEAVQALLQLFRFFELIAGRAQNLEAFSLALSGGRPETRALSVYWSSPPKRAYSSERNPDPRDLPILAARDPEAFSQVLAHWLDRGQNWFEARGRFSNSFSQLNRFDIDRLIGAANMFDILPASAAPPDAELSPEMIKARNEAQKAFKALPASPQRDSVLGALGRLAKSSLRAKILHRAEPVLEAFGGHLAGLGEVLSLAVDCRNHYVHASDAKADYNGRFFETVPFLTTSLEFVFATSDLLDAGWNPEIFMRNGTTGTHPFGSYLAGYGEALQRLNSVLPDKWQIKPNAHAQR